MGNVLVKFENQTKKFNYSGLAGKIELSNLKLKRDLITGNLKHYSDETPSDFTFALYDYYGIKTVADWSTPNCDGSEMKDFGYIREVIENLLENKLI